jgi:hypothetical protein
LNSVLTIKTHNVFFLKTFGASKVNQLKRKRGQGEEKQKEKSKERSQNTCL